MSIGALNTRAVDALRKNDIDHCVCPFLADPQHTGYAQELAIFLKVGAGSDWLAETDGQQTLRTAASASHGAAVRLLRRILCVRLVTRAGGDISDVPAGDRLF